MEVYLIISIIQMKGCFTKTTLHFLYNTPVFQTLFFMYRAPTARVILGRYTVPDPRIYYNKACLFSLDLRGKVRYRSRPKMTTKAITFRA